MINETEFRKDNRVNELYHELQECKSIRELHAQLFSCPTYHQARSFEQAVDLYFETHSCKRADVIRKAQLDVQLGYKYLNGSRRVASRDVLIRFAIAMELNLDETQALMHLNGMHLLEMSNLRDFILAIGIAYKADFYVISEWLGTSELEPLIPKSET